MDNLWDILTVIGISAGFGGVVLLVWWVAWRSVRVAITAPVFWAAVAVALAWWQFGPWLAAILLLTFIAGAYSAILFGKEILTAHNNLVEKIDYTLVPEIEKRLDDLENQLFDLKMDVKESQPGSRT